MISISSKRGKLLLRYEPEQSGPEWVDEKLRQEGQVSINNRIFTFGLDDLVDGTDPEELSEDARTFVLGIDVGVYYKIDRRILGLKQDLMLSKQTPLSMKTFIAERNISVFKKINSLVDEPIIIGGDLAGAIPFDEFQEILNSFPTSTELTLYAGARISRVLKDYFGTMSKAQLKLDSYLSQKKTIRSTSRIQILESDELNKFEYVREELDEMLKQAETYNEKDWQKLIVQFLLLIFPKYIAVLENLKIKDFYSNPIKAKDRFIDLMLVDANGTIDIIEIKKPFDNCLLSRGKYRDSYTPQAELSGSVMQVEKYIFHLKKWGREGEKQILKKQKSKLPDNFAIRITNPKAMIILGRDRDFTDDQRFDFEIIRREYANVIDIMTYDDLLRRLDNIIATIHCKFS